MICCFSGEGYYTNQDDDFIFEDFARLRLKGHEGDDTEAWVQDGWPAAGLVCSLTTRRRVTVTPA